MTSISATIAQKALRFFTKRRIFSLVKLFIALLVMTVLVRRIHPERIWEALLTVRPLYFVIALLLLGPNLYLQFFKWRYLLRLNKPEVSVVEVLTSLFAGFTFGLITPGRIGEFGRVIFIKNKPWITILGLTILDKFYSLSIVVLGGTLGLSFLLGRRLHHHFLFWAAIVFATGVLLLLLFFIFHPDAIRTLLYSLNITLPVREKIKLLIASLDHFHRKQAVTLLCLSGLFYLVFICQFYLLVLAFEAMPPWHAFEAVSSTLFVKTLLPISLGDLGIREQAAIQFFSYLNVKDTTAFNASVMLFAINVLLPSVAGLFLVFKNRLNNGTLK